MGIMDTIRKFSEKKNMKSQKFKDMEEDYRLNKMLEDRQKSSNRRELERHFKESEEKDIKMQLDMIRKQKNKESWKGNNLMKGNSMLKDDRPILKEKNIFVDNRNDVPLTKKKEMFFKW